MAHTGGDNLVWVLKMSQHLPGSWGKDISDIAPSVGKALSEFYCIEYREEEKKKNPIVR